MSALPREQLDTVRRYALSQVGGPYVYGATGTLCTPTLRQQQQKQYPEQAHNIAQYCPVLRMDQSNCVNCPYAGKVAFDCAQLVRRALETVGIRPPSGANSQWRAPIWSRKAPLAPQAASTLCVVFRLNDDAKNSVQHVGISLGDGRVVDARSHRTGVVLSQLSDYPWTHYALPAALNPPQNTVLRPGDTGEQVKTLQRLLLAAGQQLPRYGADGKFGQETLQALHAFQRRLGLAETPWADDTLIDRLQSAPKRPLTVEERLSALEREMALCRQARGA